MVWAIQARSSTISRRTIRTKSGSSWNSYQKSSWDGFKNYESMNFREEDWSKIRTLLMNSRPEFRNYRMTSIVWMTWEIFKDTESVRSEPSHVPSQPALFPSQRDPGWLPRRNNQPPDIWNSQGIWWNVCANPRASSSSHYLGELNLWISNVTKDTFVLTRTVRSVTCGERQIPDTVLNPRFWTGPSAGNSFEGRFSNNCGADQWRLQISELHFDKFVTPTTFAWWTIRFKSEVCICSQFLTEAVLWIKDVEMVESVDDLKSSRSTKRNSRSRLWVARREHCFSTEQNHPEYPLQEKGQSGENESSNRKPFLSRNTDCLFDLRILPGQWCQWFCRKLCRLIYSCGSRWWYSGIRFKMGRESFIYDTNPIWGHLGKFQLIENTRLWETQDRIGTVQYWDSSEEGRTWLSQIEDDGKNTYRA